MRLLVKDRRFLPEGALGANHDDRARRVVEHFRKRLGSVRPYRVAAGGTPRSKRSNLETDFRSQIDLGERSRVRDVDCLRIVAVDGCGHTRDLGEEPIQIVDERISDVPRCARVDLLVEAVLLRIREVTRGLPKSLSRLSTPILRCEERRDGGGAVCREVRLALSGGTA